MIDNFDNPINSNLGPDALRSLMRSLLDKNDITVKEARKQTKTLDEIQESILNQTKQFSKNIEQLKKLSQQQIDAYRGSANKKSPLTSIEKLTKKASKREERGFKLEMKATSAITSLNKMASSKHCLSTVNYQLQTLVSDGNKLHRKQLDYFIKNKYAGFDPTITQSIKNIDKAINIGHRLLREEKEEKNLKAVNSPLNLMSKEGFFQALKEDVHKFMPTASSFAGTAGGAEAGKLAMQEYGFSREMRDLAYQTAGVTKETKILQNQWETLGNEVKYTGVSRDRFQKSYVANLKLGIKDLKSANRMTETGLYLGKQIGANAESVSEMYHTWNVQLGTSIGEMDSLAAQTRIVARQTGLSGEALKNAVSSSRKIFENLKNAGTSSVTAQQAILGMTAAGEKLGVAQQIQELQEVLTSPNKYIQGLSTQIGSAIHRAAAQAGPEVAFSAMSGTLLGSPEKMKGMLTSLNKMVSTNLHVGDFIHADLEQLGDAERMRANIASQAIYGKDIGELQRMMQGIELGSKTTAEQLNDLQKEINNGGKTSAEILNLQNKQRDVKTAFSQNMLGLFDKAIDKAGGDLSKAFSDSTLTKALHDQAANMKSVFGKQAGSPMELLSMSASQMLKNLKIDAKKAGTSLQNERQVLRAIRGNNPREAIEMLNKEQKRIATITEAETDPFKGAVLKIEKTTEKIAEFIAAGNRILLNMLSSNMVIAGALTYMAFRSGFIGFFKKFNITNLAQGMDAIKSLPVTLAKKFRDLDTFLVPFKTGKARGIKAGMTPAQATGRGISKQLNYMTKGEFGKFIQPFRINKARGIKAGMTPAQATGKGLHAMLQSATKGSFGKLFDPLLSILSKLGTKIAFIFKPLTSGVTRVFGATIGKLAGAIGGLATGGILTAAITGIEGMNQSLEAGKHAAELFGVSQDKLTMSQKMAAEGAGYFTGVLNSLTFGLFNSWLGPTSKLTASLAKMIDTIPGLGFAIYASTFQLRILYAVLLGLWKFIKRVFIGVWQALKITVMPFADAINSIIQSVNEAFKGIKSFNGAGLDLVTVISEIIGFLGTLVGWALKLYATIYSYLLKGALYPLQLAFIAIASAIKPFVGLWNQFVDQVNELGTAFRELQTSLSELFTELDNLGNAILEAFGVSGVDIIGFVKSFGKGLANILITINPLVQLFKIVIGVLKTVVSWVHSFTEAINNLTAKIKSWVDYIKNLNPFRKKEPTSKTPTPTVTNAPIRAGKPERTSRFKNEFIVGTPKLYPDALAEQNRSGLVPIAVASPSGSPTAALNNSSITASPSGSPTATLNNPSITAPLVPTGTNVATTVSPDEVRARMQESAVADSASTSPVETWTEIATNTAMLATLAPILETLKEIKTQLTATGTNSTASLNPRRHRNPSKYYEMPVGSFGQSAARQATTA